MRKLLSAIRVAMGFGGKPQEASRVVSVDPNTVRFSMPTIAADNIDFVVPSPQSFEGAPQFHEDDWRQVEFYPSSQIEALMARLSELKLFEQRHRTEYGWTEIYARRIPAPGILQGQDAKTAIAELLGATAQPSPILFAASAPLGQVKNGYTIRLNDSVILYGTAGADGIESLAALVDQGGDDASLAAAYIKLYESYSLIMIHWRQQWLLESVGPDGKVIMWRP